METAAPPSAFAMPAGHPSSPPMTPGSRIHTRYPPQTSHTSPLYRRMGLSRLAQSPPLDFIKPTGDGHQFSFSRPQSRDASSRPSTPSGRAYATTPHESEDEDESDDESYQEEIKVTRRVDKADFVLEELDTDSDYDADIEVVRPDNFEDAKSDRSGTRLEETGILDKFKGLQCEEDNSSTDEEERQRIYRRKKKRWSAGIFKRSHSQSVEGDSSYSDKDIQDDPDPNARRLRRRVRGPADRRSSLVFEDRGYSNANNIVEVEEPDEGGIMHSKGPPSIPSDDAFTLDELPFWDDDMEVVEFESS